MMTGYAHSTLPWFRGACVAVVLALVATTGCVERRFIIDSNVPNALVYIDNNLVGAAPAHASFEYYGNYNITIIHPGYETFTKQLHVEAPWYSYPPLDFAAEVLWPFHIHDTRRYYFPLLELTNPRVDDLVDSAEALRQRGYSLPVPADPAPPKAPPPVAAPPSALPQPTPVVPQPGPQPGSAVPSVAPQPTPGAPLMGPGPGSGSTIPSVFPPAR
jgi:PEGA domain